MAGIKSSQTDEWSSFYNPAGGAWEGNKCLVISENLKPGFEELNTMSMAVALKKKQKCLSPSMITTGDQRLRMTKVGMSYGQKFGDDFSLGIRADLIQLSFGDIYGRKNALSIGLGGMFKMGKKSRFSFFLEGLNRPEVQSDYNVRQESGICLSWHAMASKSFRYSLELEKAIDLPIQVKAGFYYLALKDIELEMSFNQFYRNTGFAFCFSKRKVRYRLATSYQVINGITLGIGLTYLFKGNAT